MVFVSFRRNLGRSGFGIRIFDDLPFPLSSPSVRPHPSSLCFGRSRRISRAPWFRNFLLLLFVLLIFFGSRFGYNHCCELWACLRQRCRPHSRRFLVRELVLFSAKWTGLTVFGRCVSDTVVNSHRVLMLRILVAAESDFERGFGGELGRVEEETAGIESPMTGKTKVSTTHCKKNTAKISMEPTWSGNRAHSPA